VNSMRKFKGVFCLLLATTSLSALSVEERVSIPFQIFVWPSNSSPAIVRQMAGDDSSGSLNELKTRYDEESGFYELIEEDPIHQIAYLPGATDSSQEIKLPEATLSKIYRYTGPSNLTFFTESKDATGEIVRKPLANVQIPQGARHMTFLFFGIANRGYAIIPIETSLESLPRDKVLIYNITDDRLGLSLGGPKLELESGASRLVKMNSPGGIYQPVLVASRDDEGRWRRRLVRKLTVDPGEPALYLIYNRTERPESIDLVKLSGWDREVSAEE
jgi:hypothetical protein